jgi:hypothetical protein
LIDAMFADGLAFPGRYQIWASQTSPDFSSFPPHS